MGSPFFSIIIPTRNRYETLQYSIQTVLSQRFDSFELIISDNSDIENLSEKKIIEPYLKDQKVKYIRPNEALPMSDHWEFALSNAVGEYCIIFGDDDGLVFNSLQIIYDIIQKSKRPVISWARVEYNWPNSLPSEASNMMIIPYTGKSGLIDSEKYIKKVIEYKGDYRYLPMFYNSAIHKNLIKELKIKTGKVFDASSPDIYSGYAFAHLSKEYISIGYPLSINGVSGKSNGAAHLNNNTTLIDSTWSLQKKSTITWPESLPKLNTSYVGIIEPFIKLSNHFKEITNYISRKNIYQIILDNLDSNTADEHKSKMDIVLKSSENMPKLYKWIENYLKNKVYTSPVSKKVSIEERTGFNGSHLVLDASKFHLENVYDVSIFIKNIFGNKRDFDDTKFVELNLFGRIKRAGGIILRGM